MTANQRRPGFRLPWSSEMDAEGEAAVPGSDEEPMTPAATDEPAAAAEAVPPGAPPTADPEPAAELETPAVAERQPAASEGHVSEPVDAVLPPAGAGAATAPQAADEFMRDLVAAMRRVADEARDTSVTDVRTTADEQVRRLEDDAERRREQLRQRAEQDVAEVAEWEKAEAARIKREAEQRIVARRAQLDQQLSADATRTEAETKAVRERVAQYERELDAYHSQLGEINDPAAFAAAAKRMPKPPSLEAGPITSSSVATEMPAPSAETVPVGAGEPDQQVPVEPVSPASNGVPEPAHEVHPAEEEVLAARLAELDATLPPAADAADAAAPTRPQVATETATTEVVVKGLGSFGAITGFRQALSGVEGIDSVALSLGQTGEFVFRATHAAGFDLRQAITELEGDGAKIEDRPEGGLRVTLDRAR